MTEAAAAAPRIVVGEAMTPDPVRLDGLATVREAIETMRERRVASVVVERRTDADEYGILVVTDIAREVIGRNRSPDRTNVYEIMSKPVLTVNAAMDIKYAVRLLTRFGLSRALVTDRGGVVGIVTLRDLVFRSLPAPPGA